MWAISAPFDQLLGEKKSTCTPLQNPSANQSTNRGTQGTDINHGSSTTKIVFKRPLNSSETAATLTSLLQPFWSATTGTWHKGFQWFGNDTFWASSQPLRAGTGFYLASFVRKTKQRKKFQQFSPKETSHSSATKYTQNSQKWDAHTYPRPPQEIKSSQEQRENCSAPEQHPELRRSKWQSSAPHTLAGHTAQSQNFCFITQISSRWANPPFIEVRWPQLTPAVHSPPLMAWNYI